MENQGNVICNAKFKTKFNALFLAFLLIWTALVVIGVQLSGHWRSSYMGGGDNDHYLHYLGITVKHCQETYYGYGSVENYEKEPLGIIAVCVITLAIAMIPVALRAINIRIAKKATLELEEGQINGHIRGLYGITNIKLNTPIDHVDNVMVSDGLLDKFRGGKTLLISSNSGLIKFHYVQNAEEFAQAAMKRINEVKKSAPAPVPVQNISGGGAMEKLNSLKQMLENGLITQEDFDSKKADILSKM